MRRFLLIIPTLLFGLSILAPTPALAYAVPCFCKYGDTHSSWDAADKLYCPKEVYYWGTVDAMFKGTATDKCKAKCEEAGTTLAAITSVSNWDWDEYDDPDDMVALEKDQCVFIKSNLAGDYSKSEPRDENCMDPLNNFLGQSPPASCSICFCKFKQSPVIPAECFGKTQFLKLTSDASSCNDLCVRVGHESGEAVTDYGNRCDFRTSDKCAKPLNAAEEGCKNLVAAVEAQEGRILSQGSVLTLPLPLSNISVSGVVARILRAVIGIVGALALLMFVWGGIRWMLARGNPDEVAKAKKTLVWTTLGILAIFSSYAVLSLIINALIKKD